MGLREQLLELPSAKKATPLELLRIKTLVEQVVKLLGNDEINATPLSAGNLIRIPNDPNDWVVVGEWGDGTVDVIRYGSTALNSQDFLIGYRVGQTKQQYFEELRKEEEPAACAAGS